ncbi:MAG: DNA polymerase III subunit beta [Sphaerochaetaceae bacterium]|nr:DNA polymerase III subunit beta [Sphaerochaetaceae bacterium]
MKFVCEKDALIKELNIAKDFTNSKSSLSISANVYLQTSANSLTVKTTNGNMGFTNIMDVTTLEEGVTTVSCDKLNDVLKAFNGISHIIIESKKDSLLILPKDSNKNFNFEIKSIDADEFPEVETAEGKNFFTLDSSAFLDMINHTDFATSKDETRHYLCGIFFHRTEDGVAMVATDGKRLSLMNKAMSPDLIDFPAVTIPNKFVSIIKRTLPSNGTFDLALDKNTISIRIGDHTFLYSSLVEKGFPVYTRIIPNEQKFKCILNLKDTIEAINRVSLFVIDKSFRIFLQIADNKMILTSDETEQGEAVEELNCDYNGDDVTIAINYNFFLDPLKAMDGEYFSINFDSAQKPLKILAEDATDDCLHILMPIQQV